MMCLLTSQDCVCTKIEAYAMSPSLVELEAWLVVVDIWLCPWILMPSMGKRGHMTIAAISRHGR